MPTNDQLQPDGQSCPKPLTWYDLKAFVNGLDEEQLYRPLDWWGDERGGQVKGLSTLTQDFYTGDEGLEPASDLDLSDTQYMDGLTLYYKAGQPMIDVD